MADPCSEHQAAFSAITGKMSAQFGDKMRALKEKYEPIFQQIEDDAPDPDNDVEGGVGVDIDVKWSLVTFSLDLPEVTMKLQEWKFDVPQVKIKDQTLIFHTPSVRMVRKKTGQYPEFTGFPPRIKWTDIYMDVPEPFEEEQRIVMGIPEFATETVSIKLHIPEFTMKTQEIKMDLPEFTVKNVRVEMESTKERAETTTGEMQAEISSEKRNL